MIRVFRICVAVLLLVGVVGMVGCEKVADKAAEEATEALIGAGTGADVEVADDGATIELTDDEDGSSTVIETEATGLPDGFPSDFPVYEDADIVSNSTVTMADVTSFYISQSTHDEFDDVFAWHEKEYADAGWSSVASNKMEADGVSSAVISVIKGESSATLVIAEAEEGLIDMQLSVFLDE